MQDSFDWTCFPHLMMWKVSRIRCRCYTLKSSIKVFISKSFSEGVSSIIIVFLPVACDDRDVDDGGFGGMAYLSDVEMDEKD